MYCRNSIVDGGDVAGEELGEMLTEEEGEDEGEGCRE
jgi:hypothetical protein